MMFPIRISESLRPPSEIRSALVNAGQRMIAMTSGMVHFPILSLPIGRSPLCTDGYQCGARLRPCKRDVQITFRRVKLAGRIVDENGGFHSCVGCTQREKFLPCVGWRSRVGAKWSFIGKSL